MSEYTGSRSKSLKVLFEEQPKSSPFDARKRPAVSAPFKKPPPQQSVLLKRLVRVHPIDSILMGTSGGVAFVESASQQALSQGFTQPADVHNYLDLMVMFGHRFDVDPQLPWVSSALSRKSMSALFDSALGYLGVISGETGQLYIKALLRTRKCIPASLVDKICGSPGELAMLLATLHPEKCKVMRSQIPDLFALAQALTAQHSKGVRTLYPVLMFLLGSHFETDPRYAWAAELLRDSGTSEPLRYKRLHEEALSQLHLALRASSGIESLVAEVG
ncbi:hypothetical protein OV208_21385 [Corallococcus sp. bb12-1]|uniref:hypothetical protein n=1 Tax=Corallococcus sp. bb12-1 TaxID=2996784 RepID=UPI0022717FE6|nr:hypothetical protein [Corallococcus sp. bb12-1]MCY1043884.1 hypothetical protein [Corallococcus sp. bb12-1]